MKRILSLLAVLILAGSVLYSQSIVSQGKPIAEIFTDFHCNLNDSTATTGFGLNRAYLGYAFQPEGYFSGSVIVNIGNPDDLPAGAVRRRYAYFREASISYKKDKLNITFGITGTRLFDYQQKFWGKRYIANTYQSINGYGFVADLGVAVNYKFNDIWAGDITIMNGEGYSDIQMDNGVRSSLGLTFTPVKQLTVRIYGDIESVNSRYRYTLVSFIGFKNEHLTIGAEVSYKTKLDMINDHNSWGISGTGGIVILPKTELFARYDYSASRIVPGEYTQWNSLKDGQFAVVGLQYTFTENVKMALNYQGRHPYSKQKKATDAIFVNASFKF
jgi:hypothetical protein